MKKYLYCVILSVVYSTISYAQNSFSPGGVKGPIIWYKTDSLTTAFRSLISRADSLIVLKNAPATTLLNFHPSLVFNGADTLAIPLPDSGFSNATFFTAYQNKSTNVEGVVWHITKQNNTTIVFTTSRLADLETYQYMNYRDFVLSDPKIATYIQHKPKDATFPLKQTWNIGFKPHSPKLPVFSFYGIIPEVIAYDRPLSTEERLKIGSYLAIKYGITLSDPGATYLNSRGDILWNGPEYANYHHNIAGIARDDSSHLAQLKSTSSNAPGLFTISATQKVDNYASLVWGDNNKALTKADKIRGLPILLKKQWLIFAHNNKQPLTTDVTIDTRQFDVPLPPNPVYWLVIDRSGKGDFSSPDAEFVRMSSLENNGKAHFSNIAWGLHDNARDVIGIAVAQDLLARATIHDPACGDIDGGNIAVKIIGGRAPFELTVTKANGEMVYRKTINTNTTELIKGLRASKYQYTVTDAGQATYTDSFYLNSADSLQPLAVATAYSLRPGSALTLRADSGMVAGLGYQWEGPNGFHSNNPEVVINQAGRYTLKCSNGDCLYQQDIAISGLPTGMVTDNNVMVYPNPSTGPYTANVFLDQPVGVQMSVYGVDGKRVGSPQNATGKANYQFYGTLPTGAYVLQFTSGKYVVSKKIIVIN